MVNPFATPPSEEREARSNDGLHASLAASGFCLLLLLIHFVLRNTAGYLEIPPGYVSAFSDWIFLLYAATLGFAIGRNNT